MSKRFNFWLSETELEELKRKSEEERRSMSNFVKSKIFGSSKK